MEVGKTLELRLRRSTRQEVSITWQNRGCMWRPICGLDPSPRFCALLRKISHGDTRAIAATAANFWASEAQELYTSIPLEGQK